MFIKRFSSYRTKFDLKPGLQIIFKILKLNIQLIKFIFKYRQFNIILCEIGWWVIACFVQGAQFTLTSNSNFFFAF